MPGTVEAVQVLSDAGVAPATVAGLSPFEVPNNGLTLLHIKTGGGGAANLTVANKTTQDGNAGPNKVINIPVSSERIIGPFPRGIFNNANGNIECTIDTPANVTTIAFYQIGTGL